MRAADLLPELKDYYQAFEAAAADLFGFAMICNNGVSWVAEQEVMDIFLLGLEKAWFTEDDRGKFSHREFRLEFFQNVWKKALAKKTPLVEDGHVPPSQREMTFFRLPLFTRSAIFLRTKRGFSYREIAEIMDSSEGAVQAEIERARERLLGRELRAVPFLEDV